MSKIKVKKEKADFSTVGVRYLRGSDPFRIFTYRVRKGAKVYLGQELVADFGKGGNALVIVVRIDKVPEPYAYKYITGRVSPL